MMLNKYFIGEQKEFNDDDRTLVAMATTNDIDRDGEVLLADGWDLKSFRKNPVLMAFHEYWKFPVGKVLWIKPDPADKPNGLKFKAQFAETDEGLDAWYLYRNGYMSAFSVGFNPLEEAINDEKADGKKKPRRTFPKNELLEISCVPVPANAAALVEAEKDIKTKAFKEIIHDMIDHDNSPENGIDEKLAKLEAKVDELTLKLESKPEPEPDIIKIDTDTIKVVSDTIKIEPDITVQDRIAFHKGELV